MFIDSPSSMCWQRRANKLRAEQQSAYYTYIVLSMMYAVGRFEKKLLPMVCRRLQICTQSMNIYLRCVPVLNIYHQLCSWLFLCLNFQDIMPIAFVVQYIEMKMRAANRQYEKLRGGLNKTLFGSHLLRLCSYFLSQIRNWQ